MPWCGTRRACRRVAGCGIMFQEVWIVFSEGLDSLVTGAISKCWKTEIDAETLIAVLRGDADVEPWRPHLGLFFSELPIDVAVSFILKHGLRGSALRHSYESYLALGGDPNPDLEEWIDG